MSRLEQAEKWSTIIGTAVALVGLFFLVSSIRDSELSDMNGNRAWVTLAAVRVVPQEPIKADDLMSIRITPHVIGNTPAFNMSSKTVGHVRGGPAEQPDWSKTLIDAGTIVFPDQQNRFFETDQFKFADEASFSLYRDGKTHLYFWNRIYYCDAFGRLHWIQTCAFHTYGAGAGRVNYCKGIRQESDANNGHDKSTECAVRVPQPSPSVRPILNDPKTTITLPDPDTTIRLPDRQ